MTGAVKTRRRIGRGSSPRVMVKDAIELVLDERRTRGEAIPPTGWALVESVEIAA
jgi:hypothetical protein